MKVSRIEPDATGTVEWPRLDPRKPSIVTVGTFDDVHLGHQAILRRTVDLARSYSGTSVAILFDPRPGFVHGWSKAHGGKEPGPEEADPLRLSSPDQRLEHLADAGIDLALIVRYTLPFSRVSYLTFLGQLISQRLATTPQPTHTLGLHTFVMGKDAAIGRDRKGTAVAVDRIAQAFRFFQADIVDTRGPGLTRIAPLMEGEKPHKVRVWSSSNVRALLRAGDTGGAMAVLGHPHVVEGTVVHGQQRGRTLGFPTANVGPGEEGMLPADGVYSGWLVDEGPADSLRTAGKAAQGLTAQNVGVGGEDFHAPVALHRWAAAISLGTNPTFAPSGRTLEAYAITGDPSGWLDLYGHRVRVEFGPRVADMRAFPSSEALTKQMGEWVRQCAETGKAGWTDSLTGKPNVPELANR